MKIALGILANSNCATEVSEVEGREGMRSKTEDWARPAAWRWAWCRGVTRAHHLPSLRLGPGL